MKIVYCIAGTRHSGGMERVLANKANWLVKHGYEVFIITTDQCGEKPFFELDGHIKCYDLGIGYEENNGKGLLSKIIHYPGKQRKHKEKLAALLNELKADVVISMFCNDASFLPSIQDGSKKILEIHFSRYKLLQYGRKGLWALADKWRSANYVKIAKVFDKFVVLTHEDAGYWGALHNLTVIPNARTFVCETPSKLENKTVIAVGRYTYQKGYDRLIKAWALVQSKIPEWKLHIVGDGELRNEMEELIASEGVQDSVTLGRATHEMKEVYQQASIMALSSHYEGLPMVLLEAQAAGLPIVSFDCKCGPKDLIREGENGNLVKDGDIETFAKRIVEIAQNKDLRQKMGQQANEDSQRYDENIIMSKWESLFHQLVNEKK